MPFVPKHGAIVVHEISYQAASWTGRWWVMTNPKAYFYTLKKYIPLCFFRWSLKASYNHIEVWSESGNYSPVCSKEYSICYGRKVLVGHLLFMGNLLGIYLHSVGVYSGALNNNISFKIENTKIQWGSMR